MDKIKILIVEDDTLIRAFTKLLLRRGSFEIFEASNAEKALDIYDSQKLDLILLDVNLPRMSGPELLNIIRNVKNDTIPVIAVTAQNFSEIESDQFTAYIQKPFMGERLIKVIKSAMGGTR